MDGECTINNAKIRLEIWSQSRAMTAVPVTLRNMVPVVFFYVARVRVTLV